MSHFNDENSSRVPGAHFNFRKSPLLVRLSIKNGLNPVMSSQLTVFVFMAVMDSTVAEKLFHSRDHSDVEMSSSHLAELITDTDTAQVRQNHTAPVHCPPVTFLYKG